MLNKLYARYLAFPFSIMLFLLTSRTAYAQDTADTFWTRLAILDNGAGGGKALIFFLAAAVIIAAAGTAAHAVKVRRERRRTALARRLMQLLC